MALLESIYQSVLPWLPLLSISGLVMAVASIIALPWVLIHIPENYFVSAPKPKQDRSPVGWLIWLLRNTLAIVLLIVGIIMLALPGQGLLMILIALGVSSFNHKYSFERVIIRRKTVFKTVNWIRKRFNRRPIIHPDDHDNRSTASA